MFYGGAGVYIPVSIGIIIIILSRATKGKVIRD